MQLQKSAKRKGSKASDFDMFKNTFLKNYDARDSTLDGDHPKQNLVKGRRSVEDDWCWWCEFLYKKHEECAKQHGSDEPLCNVFKNGWLKDCVTSDGVVSSLFLQLCLLSFWTLSCYILYAHRDHIPVLLTIGLAC